MLARIRKAMEEREEGFTLIELLVVMLIIGILAAIAIPVFLSQTKQAHGTAVKSDLHQVETTIESVMVNSPACVDVAYASSDITVTPYATADCTGTASSGAQTVGLTSGDAMVGGTGSVSGTATDVKSADGTYCVALQYSTDTSTLYNINVDASGNSTLNSGTCTAGG